MQKLFFLTVLSALSLTFAQDFFDQSNNPSNQIPFTCVKNVFILSPAVNPECFKIIHTATGKVWFLCNSDMTTTEYNSRLNLIHAKFASQNTEITTENTQENTASSDNKEESSQTAE